MNRTFHYKRPELWKALLFFIPAGYIVFIFFRAFIGFSDLISSVVWLIFCSLAICAVLYVWQNSQVKIVVDDHGMQIKKPLGSLTVSWDEIIAYGREEHGRMKYGDYNYYIKLRNNPGRKRFIFREHLKDLKVLNACILIKAEAATLNNIAPGRV